MYIRWQKTFRTNKVLFEVLASTIYSPRIESVTVMFFTQIRFYRVYIDDGMYSLNRQNAFEQTNLNYVYTEFITAHFKLKSVSLSIIQFHNYTIV